MGLGYWFNGRVSVTHDGDQYSFQAGQQQLIMHDDSR